MRVQFVRSELITTDKNTDTTRPGRSSTAGTQCGCRVTDSLPRALPRRCSGCLPEAQHVAVFGLLSAAIVPQSWTARFVPQLWLAVFLLGLAALYAHTRLARGLGATCLLVLGVNSGLALLSMSYAEAKAVVAIGRSVSAAQQAGEICADFGSSHARIGLLRSRGVRVYRLHSRSPLRCASGEDVPSVYDFFETPLIACPCKEVAHDPTGTWRVPPDTTVQDIRESWQHPDRFESDVLTPSSARRSPHDLSKTAR
jgi:hypothetical protein